MKFSVLALGLLVAALQMPASLSMPCMGALHAQAIAAQAAPERTTPLGEWCQRPVPQMSKKAHACTCHQHNCTDPDPSHVSAHTDPKCLNYCTQANCRCERMDCP
jgi:hypothetical protein